VSKDSKLLAAGVAQDIQSLEHGALRALTPAIINARRELEADLATWLTRLGLAAEQRYSVAHIRQLLLLLGVAEQAGKRRKQSFPVTAAAAIKAVLGQAQAPQHAAKTLIRQLDLLRREFANIPPPQILTAAMVAEGSKLALNSYANSAARYAGNVRRDMQLQFATGLLKGETIGQLAKRIASISTFKAAVDLSTSRAAAHAMAGGLAMRYTHWATRLVRTELINSYNHMAVEGIKTFHAMDDRVVIMWDASLDLRVCPICRGLHGKTAPPGMPFPGGYLRPPAHPHCRCAAVAWIEEDWKEDRLLPGGLEF
jgi:SPP1 gp7 family putative phage head morphogenesis protein